MFCVEPLSEKLTKKKIISGGLKNILFGTLVIVYFIVALIFYISAPHVSIQSPQF